MIKYIYINIPSGSQKNFDIGLDRLVWGWPQRKTSGVPGEAFDQLEQSPDRTYLLFANGLATQPPMPRGWPRTPAGDLSGWGRASWKSFTLGRVTSQLYESVDPIWPDGAYPHRIRFERVSEFLAVQGRQLAPAVLEALRYSTIQQSQPALGPEPYLQAIATQLINSEQSGSLRVPDRLLGELDGLDGFARQVVRKEQSALRKARFGDGPYSVCAFCGRKLPTDILRLAHIKRRAQSNHSERVDMSNNVAACTLGCDELFERGFLTVADDGSIQVRTSLIPDDLNNFLTFYEDRIIAGFHPSQRPYFEWHRNSHWSAAD